MFSVIILDFDGFLNKIDTLCIQNGVFVSPSSSSLKNIWKFGYLKFFARINFRKLS